MSRVLLDAKDGYGVVVGLDHAMGYFLQVWDTSTKEEKVILDKDQVFTPRFGRGQLLEDVKPFLLDSPETRGL